MDRKFKSNAESKKWQQIESSASNSFKRMLEGTAKDVDFRAVSNMLANQSKLAKAVFDEGVKAIEDMADDFIDKMNKERVDSGKRPLTQKAHKRLYQSMHSNIMRNESPDLLGAVQDIVEKRITEGFDDVSTKTQQAITKGFDKLGTYAKGGELPTTDDLIALQEASSDDAEARDNRKWPSRLADIKHAVGDAVESKLVEIINKVRGGQSPVSSSTAMPSLGYSPTRAAQANTQWEVLDGDANTSAGSTNSSSIPVVQLSPKAEGAVVEAQQEQSKFHQMVQSFLQSAKDKNDESNDGDEEKKADSWFRRMGAWIKDKMPSKKGAGGKFASLLKGIGKAFLLALTAPELIDTIASKAKEYLTMDNIGKFIKSTWDGIYDTGATIVNWILQKLGLDMDSKKEKGLDPQRNTISERVDGKLAQYQKQYDGAQANLKAAGGDTSKLSERDQHHLKTLPAYIAQLKKMQEDNRSKGDMGLQKSAGSGGAPTSPAGMLAGGGNGSATIDKPKPVTDGGGYRYDPATGKFDKIDDSKPRAVEGATGGFMFDPKTNRIITPEEAKATTPTSATAPSGISSGDAWSKGSTTVAPATTVSSGGSMSVPDPARAEAATSAQAPRQAQMQSSTSLSLASIPMHAGVDDTLHLMNIGALS